MQRVGPGGNRGWGWLRRAFAGANVRRHVYSHHPLTYTCHPFVIGRGARMMMLERVIRTAADGGAVFLTMEEAVREFQQRAGRPARANARSAERRVRE